MALLFLVVIEIVYAITKRSTNNVTYSGADSFGRFKDAVNAVLTLASFAGGCFFFKGLLLMKKAALEGESSQGGDDAIWRGLTHMIFGAALTHVDKVIEAFQAIAADDGVRVVILAGAGPAFCAGADLGAVAGGRGNWLFAA